MLPAVIRVRQICFKLDTTGTLSGTKLDFAQTVIASDPVRATGAYIAL